jgi:signal transduction histidine kinase
MLSIVLLLWTGWISEKQRAIAGLVDAVMDVQIRTATSHLRLEEAIAGDTQTDVEKIIDDMDQAIKQSSLFRAEGKYKFKWIAMPFADRNLYAQSEEIKSLLVKFKMLGLTRLRNSSRSSLESSTDSEFHNVFKEILTKARILEDKIRTDQAANQKKSRRIFFSILIIWVPIVIGATTGLLSREKRKKKAEEEVLEVNKRLSAQAEELTGHREHLAALVEKGTVELTASNELLRAEIAEHKQTVEALKETDKHIRILSSRLINAQEVERRRISMELHDELGQALNATKLHMRVIEKGLKEDQRAIRDECETLIDYMDNIIENVRRLSLALSPTVLEDLGLASALKWLINSLSKVPDMKITADVEEIDQFFPRSDWITIYRVMQEAIANIGKHSSAKNVFVDIHRRDNSVHFLIQDDGKGFDLEQQSGKVLLDKGLGLTTMTERVRAMDGVLNLWSQETKGTRIIFSVPLTTKEI